MDPSESDALRSQLARLEAENGELRRLLEARAATPPASPEEAAGDSELRWQSLVESVPDFVLILDADGAIRWINRTAPGLRLEDVLGTHVLEFVPPESRDLVARALQTALETGRTVDYETQATLPQGVVWYYSFITPLRRAGQPDRLLVIARDVTERRQAAQTLRESEEKYRQLFAAVRDGVVILEPDTLLPLEFNDAACRLYGYTREEFAGRPAPSFTTEPEETAQELREIAATGQASNYYQQDHLRKDGTILPVEVSVGVFPWKGRTLLNGVIRDVTERVRAEEEKRLIERKLQETQKLESLGVLAGGLAHDFNNLLTAVLGNASLARLQAPADPQLRQCLEQIELASQRAADLCLQMLAYSGRGRFVVAPVDLGDLVRDTWPLLQHAVSKKAVLRRELAPALPAVTADAVQLRQILMNLVINASEALGDADGSVVVETGTMHAGRDYLAGAYLAPDLPAGDYVFLEVRDTGCGMAAEVKAKIFDPFFTTKFTGRGLGLAAVLGIVRGHGGALRVESEPGRGSRFRLLLPPAAAPAALPAPPTPDKGGWRGEGVVLVADDENVVRLLATRILQGAGFEVRQASDGRAALEQFQNGRDQIRLVLLDLTMPLLDGKQTLHELRRLRPDVPVILMSGFTEQEIATNFGPEAPSGFLQKPFMPHQLLTLVRRVLEGQTQPKP